MEIIGNHTIVLSPQLLRRGHEYQLIGVCSSTPWECRGVDGRKQEAALCIDKAAGWRRSLNMGTFGKRAFLPSVQPELECKVAHSKCLAAVPDRDSTTLASVIAMGQPRGYHYYSLDHPCDCATHWLVGSVKLTELA